MSQAISGVTLTFDQGLSGQGNRMKELVDFA
jgi:hypothetical protein